MFFIFSHNTCDDVATVEERAEKVLFFFPFTCEIEQQLSQVGTCEALIALSRKFYAQGFCDSFETKHCQYAFFECEPNVWMVLGMPNAQWSGAVLCETFVARKIVHSVHDIVAFFQGNVSVSSVSRYTPQMWCRSIVDTTRTLRHLRKRLRKAHYYSANDYGVTVAAKCQLFRYSGQSSQMHSRRVCIFAAKELLSRFNPRNSARQRLRMAVSAFATTLERHFHFTKSGLDYLPIDNLTFLGVHHAMTKIMKYTEVHHAALYYGGRIAWSSVSQPDLTVLSRLVALEAVERAECKNESRTSHETNIPASFSTLASCHVTHMPSGCKTECLKLVRKFCLYFPRVFLKTRCLACRQGKTEAKSKDVPHRLVIYRGGRFTFLCFLGEKNVRSEASVDVQCQPNLFCFRDNLRALLSSALPPLKQAFGKHTGRRIEHQEYAEMTRYLESDGPRNGNCCFYFLNHNRSAFSLKLGLMTRNGNIIEAPLPPKYGCKFPKECANYLPGYVWSAIDGIFFQFVTEGTVTHSQKSGVRAADRMAKALTCILLDTSFRVAFGRDVWWIIGRRSGNRTIYVLLNSKVGLLKAHNIVQAFIDEVLLLG